MEHVKKDLDALLAIIFLLPYVYRTIRFIKRKVEKCIFIYKIGQLWIKNCLYSLLLWLAF